MAALDVTRLKLSANEVQNVVVLPLPSLKELGDHGSQEVITSGSSSSPVNTETIQTWLGLKQRLFRNRLPYDVVDVSHVPLIQPATNAGTSEVHRNVIRNSAWGPPMVSEGSTDDVEIWGLTGWFLDVFLRKFRLWNEVERSSVAVSKREDTNRASL